jgi:hypothetical protein
MRHDAFGQLRLADFVRPDDLVPLRNWEYLERIWVGEAWGFTAWLRLESDPEVTRSVELALPALPASTAKTMLAALGLPLRYGMSREVDCTIQEEQGLLHLSMHSVPLPAEDDTGACATS